MTLEEYRKEIDKIDNELLEIILKRNDIIKKIKEYKKLNNLQIYDEKREQEIKQRLIKKAEEININNELINQIFDLILENSKKIQNN